MSVTSAVHAEEGSITIPICYWVGMGNKETHGGYDGGYFDYDQIVARFNA